MAQVFFFHNGVLNAGLLSEFWIDGGQECRAGGWSDRWLRVCIRHTEPASYYGTSSIERHGGRRLNRCGSGDGVLLAWQSLGTGHAAVLVARGCGGVHAACGEKNEKKKGKQLMAGGAPTSAGDIYAFGKVAEALLPTAAASGRAIHEPHAEAVGVRLRGDPHLETSCHGV